MNLHHLLALHFYIVMYEYNHPFDNQQESEVLQTLRQKIIQQAMEL